MRILVVWVGVIGGVYNGAYGDDDMTLLKSKVWSWQDIALLKWSALLVGVVVGAFFAGFVQRHILVFVLAAVLLAIRPAIHYFRGDYSVGKSDKTYWGR